MKAIQGNQNQDKKRKYFLLGIDKNYDVLEDGEHVVVMNQSDLGDLPNLKSFPNLTVIFNADQKQLAFLRTPTNMQEIILVNGDNKCGSIRKYFLINHQELISCSIKGLINVKIVKDMS